MQMHGGKFDHVTCTLYEARWGEVMKFCRKVFPLVFVIRGAWNEDAFKRDISGGNLRQQAVPSDSDFSISD
eukprot:8082489-Alexandrium_andersonii.AAC.1